MILAKDAILSLSFWIKYFIAIFTGQFLSSNPEQNQFNNKFICFFRIHINITYFLS
jgi:hypothetical protein